MNNIIITEPDELHSQIREAVEAAISDRLPDIIRRATRKQNYTTAEAADYLGISKRSLFHLKQSGQLAYSQHGRKVIYTVEELDEHLQKNKIRRRK